MVPCASTVFTVSTTGRPGTAPAAPERTAATTRSKSSTGARQRAASWTRTTSHAGSTAASPIATEAERCAPPGTTTASGGSRTPSHRVSVRSCGSAWSGGATTTRDPREDRRATVSTAYASSGRPRSRTNALGTPAPSRAPDPAATTTTPTLQGAASAAVTAVGRCPRSGREDLVEDGLGLLLVGLLRERELGDEDLAGLGEHALLAGRQAAVLVAAPQVTHDLGDLDDVPGGQLLEVGLEAARPVGRLLGEGGAEHLEHLVQAFLRHHVANTHEVTVLGGYLDDEVALGDLELEVELLLSP